METILNKIQKGLLDTILAIYIQIYIFIELSRYLEPRAIEFVASSFGPRPVVLLFWLVCAHSIFVGLLFHYIRFLSAIQ